MEDQLEDTATDFVPKRFTRSVQAYNIMLKNSEQVYEKTVWRGSAVSIIKDMGLPSSYYQGIFGFLTKTNSIRLLRRGGGTSASLWMLDHEPTYEEYQKQTSVAGVKEEKNKETRDEVVAAMSQLAIRVTTLEKESETIKKMLLKIISEREQNGSV